MNISNIDYNNRFVLYELIHRNKVPLWLQESEYKSLEDLIANERKFTSRFLYGGVENIVREYVKLLMDYYAFETLDIEDVEGTKDTFFDAIGVDPRYRHTKEAKALLYNQVDKLLNQERKWLKNT